MAAKTGLNDSFVEIQLGGETRQLVATPDALLAASRYKGGLLAMHQAVMAQDVDAYVFLLKTGLNMKEKRDKDVLAMIFDSGGLWNMQVPLVQYLLLLQNGGRQPDAQEGAEEEADEGNG